MPLSLFSQDVGCGVGGPMLEIVKFSGSHAVGLNSCDYQLKRANYHTEKAKMQDLCSYVKVSYINDKYVECWSSFPWPAACSRP